jgi:TetR/AcrR family transcriptional repressor of bet genes
MAATAEARPSRRALSKERRRQQLLDATIKCISNKGLGSLTLADVANEAGLSQGIVNLHFNSKDNLLNETLRFLAEDYDTQFMQTLEKSSQGAAETLLAIMEMDLKPAVCDRKKLAVWFAFWGEVKTVPTYQKICAAYNDKYKEILRGLCETIISEGNYVGLNAKTVTNALSSLTAVFPDHYKSAELPE